MTIPADQHEGTGKLPPFAMVPTFLTEFALPRERLPEGTTSWECVNGDSTYSVTALPSVGPDGIKRTEVPSGRYARLALLWLFAKAGAIGAVREVGRPGAPTAVELGKSAHEFLDLLGVPESGRAYKEAALQLHLVTSATWQITTSTTAKRELTEGALERRGTMNIAEDVTLWHPLESDDVEEGVIPSLPSVTFSQKALKMAGRYVMVPWAAIRQLMHLSPKSPLPLDIYLWLSARRETLEGPSKITWAQLMAQFGAQTKIRPANFKARFWDALDGPVRAVWPEAVEGMRLPDMPETHDKTGRPKVGGGEPDPEPEGGRWKGHRGVVLIGGTKGAGGMWTVPGDPYRLAMNTRVHEQLRREVDERAEARAEKRRARRRKPSPVVEPSPAEDVSAPLKEAPPELVETRSVRDRDHRPCGAPTGGRWRASGVSRSVSRPLGHDGGEE
ncbi:replication protein RepA [Micrococcus sp. M4NT]|uniref:replication protein RepA n=1 Tax=Micrococcus sp. M4NT TaxID=2957501 RepID=UPI0029AA5E2E|nr:replication protein RepA [Micrococcus sp. M4NT]MDX2342194.1 replication protein RepA [Micrococcus sp. M4NT]